METGSEAGRKVGLIVQDVEAAMPELVTENEEGVKSVNYSGAVPVFVGKRPRA